MAKLDDTQPPKRLHILYDEEIEALYSRPCLSGDERTSVFTLTQPEKDLLASFTQIPLQLYFLLQLGYFKAKQLFFAFTFDDVAEDVIYLIARYFPEPPRPDLRMPNKRTILKQRHRILKLFGHRLCTLTDRQNLLLHAKQAARISSKPIYILRELLRYLAAQRIVKPGYTFLQEELVGKAITAEGKRLATLLQTLLPSEECLALDMLLMENDELYPITRLKRQPKDFSFGEMRRELTRGESLVSLYAVAKRIVPHLDISREAITYYCRLIHKFAKTGRYASAEEKGEDMCDTKHKMAASARLRFFGYPSVSEFSAQICLIPDAPMSSKMLRAHQRPMKSVHRICTFGQVLVYSCTFGQVLLCSKQACLSLNSCV